jgi:hypothetical protein
MSNTNSGYILTMNVGQHQHFVQDTSTDPIVSVKLQATGVKIYIKQAALQTTENYEAYQVQKGSWPYKISYMNSSKRFLMKGPQVNTL